MFEEQVVQGIIADQNGTNNPNLPTNNGPVDNNPPVSQGEGQPSLENYAPPKNDSQRVEYWQSRHDKLYNTVSDLQNQINNIQANQQPEVDPTPQKPIKPNNYSEHDAYTDPDSLSAKYKSSMADYQEQMLDLYAEREQQRELAYQQEFEKQETGRKQTQFVSNIYQDVMTRGATPEKAKQFINWANSFESFSVDNLYAFYDFLQARNNQQFVSKQAKLNTPPPIGVVGGMSQPQVSEEDSFNMGFIQNRR